MDGWRADKLKVLHNMKAARQKGVETIINPAPAIPLPAEAYEGLGHLIVNETEAAILSGIENPTSWDEVAAVFISRGVQNVIITLGGEVRSHYPQYCNSDTDDRAREFSTRQPSDKPSPRTAASSQHAKSRLSTPQLLATPLPARTPLRWPIGRRSPRVLTSILMRRLHTPTVRLP